MGGNENKKGVRPINFRQVDFLIDGKEVTVAGMAKPNHSGTIIEESLQYIKDQSYDILIGLHPEKDYVAGAKAKHIDYKSMKIIDFKAPGLRNFENAYRIIQHASQNGKKVTIHCGLGFGRTGTVLAALKLRELIQSLSDEALIQQPANERFEMGPHDKFKVLNCTPLIKQAILYVRRGDEKDDSVENTLQIESLSRYQSYLVNARRQQKLQEIEAIAEPPLKATLLNAQQQCFQQMDLRALHQVLFSSDEAKPNTFAALEKLKYRYDSILSMEQALSHSSIVSNEKALTLLQTLMMSCQKLKEDVLKDIQQQSEKFISKFVAKEDITELLRQPQAVLNILSLQSELETMQDMQGNLFDNFNALILKMNEHKKNNCFGSERIQGTEIEIAINQFLTFYKTISDSDKQTLPFNITDQIEKLNMALKDNDINNKQNLINVTRAALEKVIENNETTLKNINSDPLTYQTEVENLENRLSDKLVDKIESVLSVIDRIKQNITLSHILGKSSLVKKLSKTEQEYLINNPFEIKNSANFLLIINQLSLEDWPKFLNQNQQWLRDNVLNNPSELSKIINGFDGQQNQVLMGCFNTFSGTVDRKQGFLSALLEGVLSLENKTILLSEMTSEIEKISEEKELWFLLINLEDKQRSLVLELLDNKVLTIVTSIEGLSKLLKLINDDKFKSQFMAKFQEKLPCMINQGYELVEALAYLPELQQESLIEHLRDKLEFLLTENSFTQVVSRLKSTILQSTLIELVQDNLVTLVNDVFKLNNLLQVLDAKSRLTIVQAILPRAEEIFDDLYALISTLALVNNALIKQIIGAIGSNLDNLISSVDDLNELLAELEEEQQYAVIKAMPDFILKLVNDNGGIDNLEDKLSSKQIDYVRQTLSSMTQEEKNDEVAAEEKSENKSSHHLMSQLLSPDVASKSKKEKVKVDDSSYDLNFFSGAKTDSDVDKENTARPGNQQNAKKN